MKRDWHKASSLGCFHKKAAESRYFREQSHWRTGCWEYFWAAIAFAYYVKEEKICLKFLVRICYSHHILLISCLLYCLSVAISLKILLIFLEFSNNNEFDHHYINNEINRKYLLNVVPGVIQVFYIQIV